MYKLTKRANCYGLTEGPNYRKASLEKLPENPINRGYTRYSFMTAYSVSRNNSYLKYYFETD